MVVMRTLLSCPGPANEADVSLSAEVFGVDLVRAGTDGCGIDGAGDAVRAGQLPTGTFGPGIVPVLADQVDGAAIDRG
jgi:hypothetical protein